MSLNLLSVFGLRFVYPVTNFSIPCLGISLRSIRARLLAYSVSENSKESQSQFHTHHCVYFSNYLFSQIVERETEKQQILTIDAIFGLLHSTPKNKRKKKTP